MRWSLLFLLGVFFAFPAAAEDERTKSAAPGCDTARLMVYQRDNQTPDGLREIPLRCDEGSGLYLGEGELSVSVQLVKVTIVGRRRASDFVFQIRSRDGILASRYENLLRLPLHARKVPRKNFRLYAWGHDPNLPREIMNRAPKSAQHPVLRLGSYTGSEIIILADTADRFGSRDFLER